eukprot:GGOE01041364.1.p1 GENE.GGOE01041364.1~~GGOE01041364.1.p1  ORF type:complete len:355 (-),score=65.35 GGOE01041364.1:351-1391(-)
MVAGGPLRNVCRQSVSFAVRHFSATGKLNVKPLDVPTIDLSRLHTGSPAEQAAVVSTLHQACAKWGFFKVTGHGVNQEQIRSADKAARHFFAQPDEIKRKVKRTEQNSRGWFDDELTLQTLDWKQGFDFGHKPVLSLPDDHPANLCNDGFNQWPASLPEFKAEMESYYRVMEDLAVRLTALLSLSLGLPVNYFEPFFSNHTSFLRLNYYPVSSDPSKLGIGPHKDAGFLTILYTDEVASLQVKNEGQWVTVSPDPDAFVINIGDMCQVWSNDQFVASLHRVITNQSNARISMPFFYNPNYDVNVEPVATSGKPKYRALNWGEFRRRRFEGDYADHGTEVQISEWLV